MTETERSQRKSGGRSRIVYEIESLRSEQFAAKLASQWPTAFKVTDIFFKYVSWLAIIVATKFVSENTKNWYVGKLLAIEYMAFIWSLIWLCHYLLHGAWKSDDHPIGKSIILATCATVFALFMFLFLTNPLFPLDQIVDSFEHRNDTAGQCQTARQPQR